MEGYSCRVPGLAQSCLAAKVKREIECIGESSLLIKENRLVHQEKQVDNSKSLRVIFYRGDTEEHKDVPSKRKCLSLPCPAPETVLAPWFPEDAAQTLPHSI